MKKYILINTILILSLIFALGAYASNKESGGENKIQNQQHTQITNSGTESQIMNQSQEQIQNQEQTHQQSLEEENQEEIKNENQEEVQNEIREKVKNEIEQNNRGQTLSEQHRSTVANFIQSLINIGERSSGIGQQVRIIAQQQNQSEQTIIQAMEKIQTRSQIRTFFFGPDYKNLGVIRSEMVQTRNRLDQLKRLASQIQNEGDKKELQNQVQVLEQEQVKIENFIRAQEGKVSLLGWVVKLLANYK